MDRVELMGATFDFDLRTRETRIRVADQLTSFAERREFRDSEKQELTERLAGTLGVEYEPIVEHRRLHLLSPEEVEELAGRGVDFQLHTHRHRSPADEDAYRAEVRENRRVLRSLTGEDPLHFCYPSGACHPRFARWLDREGIRSATTDRLGIAPADSDPMFLPRLLDHSGLSDAEFLSWVSGFAHWMPQRTK